MKFDFERLNRILEKEEEVEVRTRPFEYFKEGWLNRWEANLKHVGISRKIINDAIDNNPSIKHKLATDFYNNEVYLIQKCWNEYEVRWYYNGQIESDVLSSDLELECIINLS